LEHRHGGTSFGFATIGFATTCFATSDFSFETADREERAAGHGSEDPRSARPDGAHGGIRGQVACATRAPAAGLGPPLRYDPRFLVRSAAVARDSSASTSGLARPVGRWGARALPAAIVASLLLAGCSSASSEPPHGTRGVGDGGAIDAWATDGEVPGADDGGGATDATSGARDGGAADGAADGAGPYAGDAAEEGGADAGNGCFMDTAGVYGECISTSACAALGGHTSTPGYCPGPADIECCTATPNVADNPPVPAGWVLMMDSAVTSQMTTWAVAILDDPTTYPMFSTTVQVFGATTVMARVEWHPPDFQNSVIHRGVTLYVPSDGG
jgi:hypothetical protein